MTSDQSSLGVAVFSTAWSRSLGPLLKTECVVTRLLEKRAPPLPCGCEPRVDGISVRPLEP